MQHSTGSVPLTPGAVWKEKRFYKCSVLKWAVHEGSQGTQVRVQAVSQTASEAGNAKHPRHSRDVWCIYRTWWFVFRSVSRWCCFRTAGERALEVPPAPRSLNTYRQHTELYKKWYKFCVTLKTHSQPFVVLEQKFIHPISRVRAFKVLIKTNRLPE